MMAAVSLETRILKHCGKIHSGNDEEPNLFVRQPKEAV